MKLIAFNQGDSAGSNICKILIDEFGFREAGDGFERGDSLISGFDESLTIADSLPFSPDVMIVASRHKSESGQPTLTCHVTGNFGEAEVGGRPGKLAVAPALYLREAILGLRKNAVPDYGVSLEVTHHGPTELPFPLIFVEVGSTEKQWNDMEACRAAAVTIDGITKKEPEKAPVAIGFGGPHYAPNFSQVVDKVAIGHIAPKYAIDNINKDMIKQMVDKTIPRPDFALFDWKGLKGEERRKIIGMLDELNVKWKKTSEFK